MHESTGNPLVLDGSRGARVRLARLGLAYALSADLDHLAHDLRSPLQSLLMASDALFDPQAEQADLRGTARTLLEQSCRRIDRTLRGLCFPDLSDGAPEMLSLGQLLAETTTLWQLQRLQLRRELVADLPADLPAVRAPRGDLTYVLMQLLLNAFEAAESGEVTVEGRASVAGVRVRVIDRGTGVDAAAQARLFTPYWTGKDADCHLGVGLAVAAGLMAEAGIDLVLEASGSGGTVFSLWFPAPDGA